MKRLEDFLLEIVQDFDRYQSDDIELNDWAAYEWELLTPFGDRRKYADALYGTVYDMPRFTFV